MSAERFSETLVLERVFSASISKVFDAWTRPEMLSRWFGPQSIKVTEAKVDCRIGGQYSISILSPEGQQIKHYGTYLEVDIPNRLTFTWLLEDQSCQGSEGEQANTIVEIVLTERDSKTHLVLRHEKLPSKSSFDGHRMGWEGSLESLESVVNTGSLFV